MFRRVLVIFQVTVNRNDGENSYCVCNAAIGIGTVASKTDHVVQ